ncbi:MAG: hypothetical protein R6U57_13020 [Anaerolineales bacterium]
MTIDERYKYLRVMQKRYRKANKASRSALLDEMETATGLHRKSLLRLLKGNLTRKKRKKQRGRTYGHQVDDALRVILKSFDYICAERLQPNLAWMARHLAHHDELQLNQEVLSQLETISVSTVRRISERIRQDERRLPQPRRPKRRNRVTEMIPTRRIAWDEQEPGHFEVDTVHHCGPDATGDFIHTLQLIDVATGWSERAAVLGRSYLVVSNAFERVLARLPFPILEFHSDNGGEFMNNHLIRFWNQNVTSVEITRSRPYRKNDNRFVEQKNGSLVRAYFGDERFDTVQQTNLFNLIYDRMWFYYNFFQPVMRVVEKTILPSSNGQRRVKRRYDKAQTPFDRLSATNALSPEDKQQLERLRLETNPGKLREEIYSMLDQLFSLPNALPNQTENVYETLFEPLDTEP